jgi:heptaprenyl diphosphate synthase
MGITTTEDQLSEVERRLHDVLAGADMAAHLIEAGGKRLRPRLALLGARFGDPARPQVVDAAVVAELVHAATLHHDDVMDEAPRRHGVPTANALWGNNLAVLLGDLLLARAAELAVDLGQDALRLQATTLARLVNGQLLEATRPRDLDPMTHQLRVMADKSASLIAMSVELGARVAHAPDEHARALARYGERLGIAFQISDDVIDICSPATESGKTPGTDLREGVPTVPILHAAAGDDPGARRLRVILATGAVTDDARHAEALALLRSSPGLADARADVRRYVDLAVAELDPLPPIDAREELRALAYSVRNRTA